MAKLSYLSASETRALLCKYFDKVCKELTQFSLASALARLRCKSCVDVMRNVDVDGHCRWCLCVRRSVSCNLPWLSWKCSSTTSRGWCSGWRTPWIAHSSTRIVDSHSSRRNTRGVYSSCCSSAEVFPNVVSRIFSCVPNSM